jgi:hypothetical protein
VREARAANQPPRDVVVRIRAGRYPITQPLEFRAADGGTSQNSVLYCAADGDDVVISGGARILGWRAQADGTWSTTLPAVRDGSWTFRELFVGGQRRPRARLPQDGFLRMADVGPDQRTSLAYAPGDLPDALDFAGAELVFLHDWSISRVRIATVTAATRTIQLVDAVGAEADQFAMGHFESHPRYFLENARAFLDAPGEWYLDTATGLLTYWPLPEESIDHVEVVAPVADQLIRVQGTEADPVRNLHLRGLTFRHCAWNLPPHGYAGVQAGFFQWRDERHPPTGDSCIPAAVTLELAENCSIEECRLEHLGGSAIWLGRECRDCAVRGTQISDVGGSGVFIGESSQRSIDGQPWWRSAPEQTAAGNEVTDCLIERCGREAFGAVGIWIGLASATVVEHNLIRDLPYTGVSLGWMWNPTPTPCHHHRIERNEIHHVMQVLSDGGGIYTLGRQPGTVLRQNRIYAVPLNSGRAESNGMFLDEGTAEVVIEGNLIFNVDRSPLRFHRAEKNLVRDNRLVVGPEVPPVRFNATPETHIELQNNTIVPAGEFDPPSWEPSGSPVGPRPKYASRFGLGKQSSQRIDQ